MAHSYLVRISLSLLSVAVFAGSAVAQHTGHGAMRGTHGAPVAQGHGQMMAGEQMMRNVDSSMLRAESMMRDLSAMSMEGGRHDQMIDGMRGMLEQMRGLHGHLTGVMKDPQFTHDGSATKAFNAACRELEKMASAFESMTKHMNQAMKGPHHEPK